MATVDPMKPAEPNRTELESRQRMFWGPKRLGVLSLVFGLTSIALNIYPAALVIPLQEWLGAFVPVFLPFFSGALAFGFGLLSLLRSKAAYWLSITGLVLGALGMALGCLIAVTMLFMLLYARGNGSVPQ